MASTKGGQRLIVSSSRILIALKACVGIAFSQPVRHIVACIGDGSFPFSCAWQRNFSVSGSVLLVIITLGSVEPECASYHVLRLFRKQYISVDVLIVEAFRLRSR